MEKSQELFVPAGFLKIKLPTLVGPSETRRGILTTLLDASSQTSKNSSITNKFERLNAVSAEIRDALVDFDGACEIFDWCGNFQRRVVFPTTTNIGRKWMSLFEIMAHLYRPRAEVPKIGIVDNVGEVDVEHSSANAISHFMATFRKNPEIYPVTAVLLEKFATRGHNSVLTNVFIGTHKNDLDLYVADCGTPTTDPDLYPKLFLLQTIVGLTVLKPGGNLVMTQYDFSSPSSIGVMDQLSTLFEHLYLFKPVSSQTFRPEVYVVGVDYRGSLDDPRTLLKLVKKWRPDKFIDFSAGDTFVAGLYNAYSIILSNCLKSARAISPFVSVARDAGAGRIRARFAETFRLMESKLATSTDIEFHNRVRRLVIKNSKSEA